MPTAYENDLRSHDASLGAPAGRPDTVTAGKDDDPVLVHGVDASILTRGRLTSHTHQCLPSCRRCRPGLHGGSRTRRRMDRYARPAAWLASPRPHGCYQTRYHTPPGRRGPPRSPLPEAEPAPRARRLLPAALSDGRMDQNEACADKPGLETSPFSPGPLRSNRPVDAAPATRLHRKSFFFFLRWG